MLKESFAESVAGVKALVGKAVDVVHATFEGLAAKMKTASGALTIVIAIILLWDAFQKGNLGVIAYSIDQVKVILMIMTDVVKAGGWPLVIVVLILAMMKKDKK